MKTLQEYLKAADREKLLGAIAYNIICDSIFLLECGEKTIVEIQEGYKKYMNDFIEYLLSLEAIRSDRMVLYMCDATSFERVLNHGSHSVCLADIEEVKKNIYVTDYDFGFSDCREVSGYLVAENKLTQDHLTELLAQSLHTMRVFRDWRTP